MEILLVFPKEKKKIVERALKLAIIKANKVVPLNVSIDISIDFGDNYAACH